MAPQRLVRELPLDGKKVLPRPDNGQTKRQWANGRTYPKATDTDAANNSKRPCPLSASVIGYAADRKSTRLNSSHVAISYAVFCLKKKTKTTSNPSKSSNLYITKFN